MSSSNKKRSAKRFIDQLGNHLVLSQRPKRIVSLVPSQTELLFDLGLNEEVVGITKFCVHPAEKFRAVTKVGGTKDFKLEAIRQLRPDLIIANKEENEQAKIEALQTAFPVWVSDVRDLESALQMIGEVGRLVGKVRTAAQMVTQLRHDFEKLKTAPAQKPPTVLYLIWRKPYMVAGAGTFIDDMLNRCGFQNVASGARYPVLSEKEMSGLKPQHIFLSSEPYPFKEKHLEELKAICPQANIQLVDGELFSWYGSRLLQSVNYFKTLIGQSP